MVKIGVKVGTCASLPHAKFCKKNRLRRYTPLGQIYTRNCWNIRAYSCQPCVFTIMGPATHPFARGRHHAVP